MTPHPRHRLDPLIHAPVRLSIVACLAAADKAEFSFVRDTVEVSDSVLSKQETLLAEAGYVRVRKGYVGKRPRTWLSLTNQGRDALREPRRRPHRDRRPARTGGEQDEMTDQVTTPSVRPPGAYGFDAPRLLAVPMLLIVAGVVQGVLGHTGWPIVGAALVLLCCGLGLYASRRGKFVVWSVDLVVSNLVVHNLVGAEARNQALDEAVRVLRPGGRLMIADLWGTRSYEHHLRALGLTGVTRRSLGWRQWWSGPWLATHLVTATLKDESVRPQLP